MQPQLDIMYNDKMSKNLIILSRVAFACFFSFWSNFYQYIVVWTLKSSCTPGIHATHIVATVVC